MPQHSDRKSAARAYAAENGLSYTAALRRLGGSTHQRVPAGPSFPVLPAGARLRVEGSRQFFTVRSVSSSGRFAVLSRPHFGQPRFFVLDLELGVLGNDNRFGLGYGTDELDAAALVELESGRAEVSWRSWDWLRLGDSQPDIDTATLASLRRAVAAAPPRWQNDYRPRTAYETLTWRMEPGRPSMDDFADAWPAHDGDRYLVGAWVGEVEYSPSVFVGLGGVVEASTDPAYPDPSLRLEGVSDLVSLTQVQMLPDGAALAFAGTWWTERDYSAWAHGRSHLSPSQAVDGWNSLALVKGTVVSSGGTSGLLDGPAYLHDGLAWVPLASGSPLADTVGPAALMGSLDPVRAVHGAVAGRDGRWVLV